MFYQLDRRDPQDCLYRWLIKRSGKFRKIWTDPDLVHLSNTPFQSKVITSASFKITQEITVHICMYLQFKGTRIECGPPPQSKGTTISVTCRTVHCEAEYRYAISYTDINSLLDIVELMKDSTDRFLWCIRPISKPVLRYISQEQYYYGYWT